MATQSELCPPPMPLVRTILLLQEKWVLFIVLGLVDGPLGFNELGRRARGVNTTTLSQRMEMLEREGIVTKEVHSTMPPKTSYTLTTAGQELRTVLEAMADWGARHRQEATEADAACDE